MHAASAMMTAFPSYSCFQTGCDEYGCLVNLTAVGAKIIIDNTPGKSPVNLFDEACDMGLNQEQPPGLVFRLDLGGNLQHQYV